MRLGEALGLHWGDIDFDGGFINGSRTLSRGRLTTPKNGKGRRVVMSKQLAATLQEHRTTQKRRALEMGMGEVQKWVFTNQAGRPVEQANFRHRVWYKALEKAALSSRRIHDLRHTYATLLIQAGEPLAFVRDQLGHHSIKLTVDTYGHLAPEGNRAAVDRLDDLDYKPHFSASHADPGEN